MLPLLTGPASAWADRTLFTQWHRGDVPERYRAFAARGPRYKLVQAAGVQPGKDFTPKYELFDTLNDPYEQTDLAAKLPDEVAKLKQEYEAWFADVTKKGFDPPRIVIGSEKENPVRLTRQDWRGPNASWGPEGEGHWEVTVERAGKYWITLWSDVPFSRSGLRTREERYNYDSTAPADRIRKTMKLPRGENRLQAWVESNGKRRGVKYLEVEYAGEK